MTDHSALIAKVRPLVERDNAGDPKGVVHARAALLAVSSMDLARAAVELHDECERLRKALDDLAEKADIIEHPGAYAYMIGAIRAAQESSR
jgi:two-component SAPR family response regulator